MEIKTYSKRELKKIRSNLLQEMILANKGKLSSLLFAKTIIPSTNYPDHSQAQIIVVGGSNLISATVIKDKNDINILSINKQKVPILDNKEIVMKCLGSILKPNLKNIILNFGYPMQSIIRDNRVDGKIIRGTKEHRFEGLINKNIGEEFEKYIKKKQNKNIFVHAANDTVCLVLSGISRTQPKETVGGIVGTGFNFGLFTNEKTIVNMEAGGFDKFEMTESGKYIDKNSENPGAHKFEKEISGGYLYKHYNYYAEKYNLTDKNLESTQDIDAILLKNDQCSEVIKTILKRSASLVACQIAAIYYFKKQNSFSIYMEGSLFWKAKGYKEYVFEYLLEMGIPYGKIKIEKIEKSYILGAARIIF